MLEESKKIEERIIKPLNAKIVINNFNNYLMYKKNLNNSIETIKNQKNCINSFINFIVNTKCNSITKDTIITYIKTLSNKADSTKDKYLKTLKLFFRYLFEENYTEINYEILIPKTKYLLKSKIPFCWKNEDINKLLNSIDNDTLIGKRDYAMFLIIIRLGLRAIDVINLKLNNIDWKNNQIKFYQHKTSQYQCLPLIPEVGNAILDYILHSRNNKLNVEYLFLDKDKNIVTSRFLTKLLYKYEKKANIIVNPKQKNGVHSLRNTLVSNLLSNDTPIDTISQVLGHVNLQATLIYLKIDLNKLRECILDWRLL